MLNVSENVKTAYANPSSAKTLVIYFPSLDITVNPDDVAVESLKLTEAIMDNTEIQFVGCIPSKLQVQIQNFTTDVKGLPIQVSIYTDTTENEPIILFNGIVDSVTQQSNKKIKEIVAYDMLYSTGNINIAEWYIDLLPSGEYITLKDFRTALFEEIELDYIETDLVNDDLSFTKQYSPVTMKALDIIKYICQINGVFGVINRENKFEFRQLLPMSQMTPINVGIYKNIEYQEFTVNPVDKLIIRQNDQDEGISTGDGNNAYVIQGNFFTLNLEEEDLTALAENLYPNLANITYVPHRTTQIAYPWIECGDVVQYQVYDFEASQAQGEDVYTAMNFYVLERYLTGIQAIRDEYEAQGEEYQSLFISDVNAKIDTVKDQIEQVQGTLNTMGLKYTMFYNTQAIDIADGERTPIASTEFAVSRASQVYMEIEYLIRCETTQEEDNNTISLDDLVVTVNYEYDGAFLDSRQPIETFTDGKHILHTWYVINVPDAQPHTWRIFLECAGGSIHINALEAQSMILGFDTFVEAMWDGVIRAEDIFEPLTFGGFIGRFTDSVSVNTQNPTPANASDVFPTLTFGGFISGFTDSVEFSRVTDNYTVDVEKTVTYDTDYVKITNGVFELETKYIYTSTAVTIDSGTLKVVALDDLDDYATVTQAEEIE